MSDYFPEEIWIEIFVRLPVKILIRSTLVSKTWQCLITSSHFISKHLSNVENQKKEIPSTLLMRHYSTTDEEERYTLHIDSEDSICKPSEVNFPVKPSISKSFFQIVGCCNGLICLCDDQFGTYLPKPLFLFNPSIQRYLVLPLPTILPRSTDYILGFGCDLEKFDFKVLRIVYGSVSVEAEVYSLNKRSWESVKPFEDKLYNLYGTSRQALCNGAVHWIAYTLKVLGNYVMCFDFSDEEFKKILLPNALAASHYVNLYVNVHRDDELAVMEYFYNDSINSCGIWVMQEYGVVGSWKKLYNINLVAGMDEVIGFRKNGELLVTMLINDPLPHDLRRAVVVSYDPKSSLTKNLGVTGWMRSLYVHNFLETLVLLDEQIGIVIPYYTF